MEGPGPRLVESPYARRGDGASLLLRNMSRNEARASAYVVPVFASSHISLPRALQRACAAAHGSRTRASRTAMLSKQQMRQSARAARHRVSAARVADVTREPQSVWRLRGEAARATRKQ
jgi:hypothetical protein